MYIYSNIELKNMLLKILKIPGIKINRKDFLLKTFTKDTIGEKNLSILKLGPIEAGITKDELHKISDNIIQKEAIFSTSASFLSGIPGGLLQIFTVPTDMLQFFAVSLRICQKLCYLYGFDDIWDGYEDVDIIDRFILFIGVMFGIAGANETVRIMSSAISKTILKKMPQRPIWDKLYLPIINKVSASLGIQLSKQSTSKSFSKAIPIIGGIISGTVTYLSIKPMGENLRNVFEESNFNYSAKNLYNDLNFIEVDFEVDNKNF